MGAGEADRHDAFAKQLRWHSQLLHELAVESVHTPRIEQWVRAFLSENGLPAGVDLTLSPDDRMFQYLLYTMAGHRDAVAEYFASGAQVYGVVEAVGAARFGSLDGVSSVLDFAAGHGRVDRFLAARLGGERVWVSDIKPGAVEFQTAQFGVSGVASAARPEEFRPGREFDLILVASLFTHLPDAEFRGWLRRLWGLLAPRGVLVFSTHDAWVTDGRPERHRFTRVNEDLFLDGVVGLGSRDGALDAGEYGMTWAEEGYVAEVIAESCGGAQYVRYPRGLDSKLQRQDLFLVSPAGVDDLRGLTFPRYLMVENYRNLGWSGSWINAVRERAADAPRPLSPGGQHAIDKHD